MALRLEHSEYHGNNEKEGQIVISIPANNDDEDLDDFQAGHCGVIDQGKKLSVRNPDICPGSILPEHVR